MVDKGKNIGLNFVLLKDHKHKKNDGRKTIKNTYKDIKILMDPCWHGSQCDLSSEYPSILSRTVVLQISF